MIHYRRQALPSPVEALAWREPPDASTGRARLAVTVAEQLSPKDARHAALSAIRRLPRGHQPLPRLSALVLPALWLVGHLLDNRGRSKLAAVVAAAVATAGTATITYEGVPHTPRRRAPAISEAGVGPVPAPPIPRPSVAADGSSAPQPKPTSSPTATAPPTPTPSPTLEETETPTATPGVPPTATPTPTPTPTESPSESPCVRVNKHGCIPGGPPPLALVTA